MNCEKCGTENAHFTGNSKSWGPDACEAENVPENLPGGYAWLCEECDMELWFEDCDYQCQK